MPSCAARMFTERIVGVTGKQREFGATRSARMLVQQQQRHAVQRANNNLRSCCSRRRVAVRVEATKTDYWQWKSHKIRYQSSGESGPPILLVHGFGGNCDHWRKNTPILGQRFRAYSIDLLGYGFSDKPNPRLAPPNSIYNFEQWGDQLTDFIEEVIGEPTYISTNSVGGLAGLCAGISRPDIVRGVQLINISLRGLHVERQQPWQRPLVASFQRLLKDTPLGAAFFGSVATPNTVKNILCQAYANDGAVTDELVDAILKPGLEPGAVDVFLDFISYSGGPLPEQLLAKVPPGVPVSILWGADDPWEDMKEGRRLFAHYPCVTEFVELPGVGHCPQDEAPEIVNPLIEAWVLNSSSSSSNGGSSSQQGGEAAAVVAAAAPGGSTAQTSES